jgi:hypothetical protein
MKGKISAKLNSILKDPRAREQLRKTLIQGHSGQITFEGKTYILSNVLMPENSASGATTVNHAARSRDLEQDLQDKDK